MPRTFPRPIKRVVVKIGSSVIATYRMKPRTAQFKSIVAQICRLQKKNIDVVLVSSGAIVLGMGELNTRQRTKDVAGLQAMAAIGQTVLMRLYSELFKKNGGRCAQILLTWDDFDDRRRYNNARNTLKALLERGVIPVVNENDTISTDEIRFGDNDRLSALVAGLIHADLLLVLTDVEGLYDMSSGRRKVFKEIKEITQDIEGIAGGTQKKQMAKGGMRGKLEAVKVSTQANIPTVIANGETKDVIGRVLSGERIGTFFSEKEEKLLSRKHWVAFGAKSKGRLIIDNGAKTALLKDGRSLLLPGLVSWDGHFRAGDVVIVCDQQDHEIARGVVNYSVSDLLKLGEKKGQRELIHRDDLVINKKD